MRKLILILFILLSCASLANSGGIISFPGGGMPSAAGSATITYDTAASNWVGGTGAVVTVTIDPGDGHSDKIFIIGVGWEDTNVATITSVVYDEGGVGGAATNIDTQTYTDGSDNGGVALYYYLAPLDTSKVITVTFSETIDNMNVGVISLYNVKQQAPEASNKAAGTGTTAAVTVTTITANAWVSDIVANSASYYTNIAATMDERWVQNGGLTVDASTIAKVSPGGQSMSWTVEGSKPWVIVGAAWEPADL